MRLRALAKINLGLDIIGKRDDGYHEVRMIMQTIQMYDVLEIQKKDTPVDRSTNLKCLIKTSKVTGQKNPTET